MSGIYVMIKRQYRNVESLKVMGKASKPVLGPDISVLLWNIFKCKKMGWYEDFIRLANDTDVVIIQEAILNSPFDKYFTHSLQHQWIMARSFKHIKSNIETGVKTGSMVAAYKHDFSISEYGEPFTNTKKSVLATIYPLCIKDKSLLVVNAHIINFVLFNKYKAHIDQVFKLLEGHIGPIILAGDFNTWSGKRKQYFNQLAGLLDLHEVIIKRQPRFMHLLQHLDHIYYRGLTVANVYAHTEITSSDHFPISLSAQVIDTTN